MSASDPGAITPFCGYMLKIFAAVVLVTETNLSGLMIPECTPLSQMTDILSSNPFTPFGIFVKSFSPIAFCLLLKVQLSVPVPEKKLSQS